MRMYMSRMLRDNSVFWHGMLVANQKVRNLSVEMKIAFNMNNEKAHNKTMSIHLV